MAHTNLRWKKSDKLADVLYDIRGPVLAEAQRLEDEGHHILKLNIGNPAPFGFNAPDEIQQDYIRELPHAQGYSDSKGILSARRAIVQHYEERGFGGFDVDRVYLGNGVSELIAMAMSALLNNGDEVLIPSPDYPLWTAAVTLSGGRPVHYVCDEGADWAPDLADIESKITSSTVALVVINPNNPTGAVYPEEVVRGLADIAARHGLVLCADEIYDKVLYDDAKHTLAAAMAPDVLTLTFNGLSKAYRVAGYRSGWLAISGPVERATDYLSGIDMLANMRLCANVPAQHVIQTALGGRQSIAALVAPGGRLARQRNVAHDLLTSIPGVSCTMPKGALYLFPRIDTAMYGIESDEQFVLDFLRAERVLLVHGTGFNLVTPDHFRIVTLPPEDTLIDALGRLERFLGRRRGAR
ncbi:MAG: pyridoxal phosphate-dependent aminotransferase [Candidatus Microthrix subdominans]|uniref:alanine transaminase n=1 Tax=Candidatus Neomicrothrix subdominans TaxID=2954438 RepID=A0A936N914_9ACTN|nr:pyridoxal phosphate-dependent aminotransferase [Candidatus Microthrix sp.]MBK9295863.1 pyridoxal phosphate-dependent aminotransferase [Candidatus Microthrix subdominans]MBK6310686.1 pyridoxal phosphate-dependent aminotransferase [Candidatus Microthrix sp.]MBK6438669.1 pyridoxal phosphate-dependent aminotransferase [Candidatus Microthrix sp.]MBK6968971.1 pyridoxal phosphate-dependent aminotransferase [Candidatus Microthrix sp.]MBK9559794.1 pyridoxal phosphate-dependent aminotransferase [Cand